MVTFVWLEGEIGQLGGWRCAEMGCGRLSVTDIRSGTPWMPLWCAGSCTMTTKVRTICHFLQSNFRLISQDLLAVVACSTILQVTKGWVGSGSFLAMLIMPYCSHVGVGEDGRLEGEICDSATLVSVN